MNLKEDFPILNTKVDNKELIYLDNSATTQKPHQVINAIYDFYTNHNSNVKRGSYTLSDRATDMLENTRKKVADFIGAQVAREIVFTKNSTEALNLVAFSWGGTYLKKDDELITTEAEHNSHLLPWLQIARAVGAKVRFIEANETGEISLDELEKAVTEKTKVIFVTHASNVLGNIQPIRAISKIAKKVGAIVVVDGSQAAPNMPINMQELGCDFYAFSAHKMLGPMGIGVLWGKRELLENMPPVVFGGGMVKTFDLENPHWSDIPDRFEAGTPDVAGVIGLGAALDYLNEKGMANIREHEIELNTYALAKLSEIENLQILGPKEPEKRVGLVAFSIPNIHSHDIAAVLNQEGICVRSGLHCTMNLYKSMKFPSSTRASWYVYNTTEDIDRLVEGVKKAISLLL